MEINVKLHPFTEDVTLCIENYKEYIHTHLLKITNKFSKVTKYMINKQKSSLFLYINNEQFENEIKKTILFIVASKNT